MKAHLLKLNDGSKGSRSKIIHHPKPSTDPSAGYLRFGGFINTTRHSRICWARTHCRAVTRNVLRRVVIARK